MLKKRRVTIDISLSSVFWVIVTILSIFFISSIYKIIILLFASTIIAFSVNPLIQKLEAKKIPRSISSLVVLILFFSIFGFIISTLVSPILAQSQQLLQRIPELISKLIPYNINFSDITTQFSNVPGKFVNIAVDTFSTVISTLVVIVISYYLLQERAKLEYYLKFWFGEKGSAYFKIAIDLEKKIGYWFIGQLVLMLIIGVMAYLGYLIIGTSYALPLALIAGLLEILPNLGPIIATILAAIVGFSVSPSMGMGAIVVNVIIQQLENNLIVPTVMRHAAGLNPIVTILAIMIGLEIGGPLMSILAIPLVLSIRVILTHIKLNKTTTLPEIH